MSIKSYQKNVRAGAADPELGVCYPAAIEQLSRFGYSSDIYQAYLDFCDNWEQYTERERRKNIHEYEDLIDRLVRPLGGLAFDDVIFKTVTSVNGLRRAYRKLCDEGYNIVLDIACEPKDVIPHGVGLIPIEGNYVTLVSTHIPKKLQGIVHIDKVAACLFVHDDEKLPGHPCHTGNLTAIPNL